MGCSVWCRERYLTSGVLTGRSWIRRSAARRHRAAASTRRHQGTSALPVLTLLHHSMLRTEWLVPTNKLNFQCPHVKQVPLPCVCVSLGLSAVDRDADEHPHPDRRSGLRRSCSCRPRRSSLHLQPPFHRQHGRPGQCPRLHT